MTATEFIIGGIDPAPADELRARGGLTYIADDNGYPCRQCLRDAEIGDELILVSYDPFAGSSPYRSASPIFLHLSPCIPDELGNDHVPDQLARRTLSVRAFDDAEIMVDAALTEGADLSSAIRQLLGHSNVRHLHVHNEPRGCWAARVDRA